MRIIEAMKELGIDISKQRPKIITEDMVRESTARVNMGCIQRESCPTLFIHNVSDWNIEYSRQTIRESKRDSDVIESRVKELVTNLIQTNQQVNT